ncbi:MAG: RNA 2',3'-cyclic phosphodiesterase [candidate division Zixibacteria bacterium]|nr:RNA 2',3'-cyclic phosphodiesterase [candidate division Zixibacteria bacterium]
MMRLFIALPLGPQVEAYLGEIAGLLKQKGGAVKWVDARNIHLTVRFLGDTEEAHVGALKELLDTVAGRHAPVQATIDRLGAFPNLRRPRIFWAGLRDSLDALENLATEVEQGVRRLGFEPEQKRFKPHLTLGRVRKNQGLDSLAAFIESFEFVETPLKLDRLVLFKSTLTPRGPIYDRLHEAMLGETRFEG